MNSLKIARKYILSGLLLLVASCFIFLMLDGVLSVFTRVKKGSDFSSSYTEVVNLDIEASAGKLIVTEGDVLSVKAKRISKDFSCTKTDDGTLVVRQGTPIVNFVEFEPTVITITLPKDFAPSRVKLVSGAGKVEIKALHTEFLDLSMGAGQLIGEDLIATGVDIKGGAGQMTFTNCNFTDLSLKTGVGETNFTGILKGDNSVKCGVGAVNLLIHDSSDNFDLTTNTGIGRISVNGETASNIHWGNLTAQHSLKVNGGIGAVNITFSGAQAA